MEGLSGGPPNVAAGQGRTYDMPFPEGVLFDKSDVPVPGSAEHDALATQRSMYMSIVGGLNWLSVMTFPDIAYATSQLSRFMTNPGPEHIKAAMRVLAYLHSNRERTLEFRPSTTLGFEVYVDSNWSSGFSCSGALFFLHGCLFAWFSKMQHSVSLSTAEAEYFGAMLAARDLLFIRDLLVDFGFVLDGPTPMYSDSKSAIDMSFDPVAFKNTKHIMRAAAFLRDIVAKASAILRHKQGIDNMADLLTKPVSRSTFITLLRRLDAYPSPVHESEGSA